MTLIRKFSMDEGICVFDTALDSRSTYDGAHLDQLAHAEKNHFWFTARKDKICRVFSKRVHKEAKILEIGGGTGYVAASLNQLGYSVYLSDIYKNGLRFAKERGVDKLYQFDLFNPPFENEFDVVCLFDVLEHLEDDREALRCIGKMLKPKGQVILTVPAHQWLWSRDDRIAGHWRRYTKHSLSAALIESQFNIAEISYFFSLILPLLWLRRWVKPDSDRPVSEIEGVSFQIHPAVNQFLKALMKGERFIESAFSKLAGGSMLAVGVKDV